MLSRFVGLSRRLSTLPKPEEAIEFLSEVTGGAKGLPRASIVQSMAGNNLTKMYLRTACPGFFDALDTDVPKGAIAGLEILPAALSSDEFMVILNQCAEKKFFDEYKNAVSVLNGLFSWKLDRIKQARVDGIHTVIGAQRGDSMKGKQFMEFFGQHLVVSPEFANAIRIQSFSERASKSLPFLFADGAVVRARVLVTVDQTVTLPTVSESGDLEAGKPESVKDLEHLVTLEISLTPRIGKKQMLAADSLLELTAEDPMTAGEWYIADVNFSLSDNYPLDPPTPEDSTEKPEDSKKPDDQNRP